MSGAARQQAIGMALALLAAPVLLLGVFPLRDGIVVFALLTGGHLLAMRWTLSERPRDAREDLRPPIALLAVMGGALLVLAALNASEGHAPFAALYGACAAAAAAAAAVMLAVARFVRSLPDVLRGDERARVVVFGRAAVNGRMGAVGVVATDAGLVVAVRRGLRAVRHEDVPFRELTEFAIDRQGAAGVLTASGEGRTLIVMGIPLGQATALGNHLRTRLRAA